MNKNHLIQIKNFDYRNSKQMFRYFFLTLSFALFVLTFLSCKSNIAGISDNTTFYTCSMDPQVLESMPGKCPICHMALTPVKKTAASNKHELILSEQQIQLGNIHADTLKSGSIGDQLMLTGTVNVDQSKTAAIGARVGGRIDHLFFKSQGDYVKKGAALYEIYSEELNNAKQEYLLALERRKAFTGEPQIDFGQLLESAKNKLLIAGMTLQQINELSHSKNPSSLTTCYSPASGYITSLEILEGQYVPEGGVIMMLADLSTVWVEAQVYTSQLSAIDRNATASVRFPGTGTNDITGKIDFVNPEINPDTRINLIRVSVANPANRLYPGMSAFVTLKSRQHQSLNLPADAVIRDGSKALVWLKTGDRSFKLKQVETGMEDGDQIEIKSGLGIGDVVVTSGVYLLNSEYLLKSGGNVE